MHEDEPLKAGLTLVLGGARSGKTQRALKLAEQAPQRTMIATAEAWDDEMADRIAAHKAERGSGWCTIEAPIDICNAINEDKTDAGSVGAIGRLCTVRSSSIA
ncbi:MAG: bifunctional adenosylcobinamide kinase/adenosylcobinamide-phosphate guanylyltransferase [Pseudomonadota bacterium]